MPKARPFLLPVTPLNNKHPCPPPQTPAFVVTFAEIKNEMVKIHPDVIKAAAKKNYAIIYSLPQTKIVDGASLHIPAEMRGMYVKALQMTPSEKVFKTHKAQGWGVLNSTQVKELAAKLPTQSETLPQNLSAYEKENDGQSLPQAKAETKAPQKVGRKKAEDAITD